MPLPNRFDILFSGERILVQYDPVTVRHGGRAHMQFFASVRGIALSISPTGYRSHVTSDELVQQIGGPEPYAYAFCRAALRRIDERSVRDLEPTRRDILREAGIIEPDPSEGQLGLF